MGKKRQLTARPLPEQLLPYHMVMDGKYGGRWDGPLLFTILVDASLSDMIMVRGCQGTYNIGLEYWLQYGG